MDGQEPDAPRGRAKPPTEAELEKLRGFLGSATDAGSPGVYKGTGERPDNVRPLAARREHPTREAD